MPSMIDFESEFPFLWRLSPESSEGFCAVSMVVAYEENDQRQDLTIETSVQSLASDTSRAETEETLEWNDDDISLFLKMVNYRRQRSNLPISDNVRIDLADPAIIEIINVVAAAGFGTAYASNGLLIDPISKYSSFHCHVGGRAALNTVGGYKACVVVDVDDDDAVCVLLEDIEIDDEENIEQIRRHDLLLVKRNDIVHPGFTSLDQPTQKFPSH